MCKERCVIGACVVAAMSGVASAEPLRLELGGLVTNVSDTTGTPFGGTLIGDAWSMVFEFASMADSVTATEARWQASISSATLTVGSLMLTLDPLAMDQGIALTDSAVPSGDQLFVGGLTPSNLRARASLFGELAGFPSLPESVDFSATFETFAVTQPNNRAVINGSFTSYELTVIPTPGGIALGVAACGVALRRRRGM